MTAAAVLPTTGDPDRASVVASLRRRLAAVPGKGAVADPVADPVAEPVVAGAGPVLAVPGPLAALLPRGGLVRGTVVAFSGASSLLLGLLAAVTADGGWAGVVGRPGLGLLAAAEMGADLQRLALVPRPGADAVDVAAVLLDGLDLVVLDLAGATVVPSRARGLVARARHRGGVLVVTGGQWPGASLELRAEVRSCSGLGAGHGRLRSRELVVQVRGRGQAGQGCSGRVALQPAAGVVGWAAAGPRAGLVPELAIALR